MTLSAEDRLAIVELYARYSHAYDEGRGEEVARLFTPDGAFVREGAEPVTGRANLAAMASAAAGRGMRHVVSNVLVEPAPDGARGSAYVLVLLIDPTIFGRYDDEFRLTPDGWRIHTRRFTALT